jgi:hypothetical protein
MSTRLDGITIGPGEMRHHSFSTTTYLYTCAICKKPGTDNIPNTGTHPGECRAEAKRRRDAENYRKKQAKKARAKVRKTAA